jgi:DNA-binding response OmpR family regulator
MKILLVEDEQRMADAVAELLHREHYEVDIRHDGTSGLDAALSGLYDAMILDVMLPGMSGFDVVKECRKSNIHTPILMLTAKSSTMDKVTGLDSGADDYLTKPFQVEELLARVRALCRRNAPEADGLLQACGITLSQKSASVQCIKTGHEVRLSEKEYHLLEIFIMNHDQIISREQLALKVWGYENEAEYNNVEVYISFLRKKLAFIGAGAQIKAARGLGYELRDDND